jgi:uncharacterized protein YmfQ (DUF2313 family)
MNDPPADSWVQRTAVEYAAGFNNLLPTGPAWPREPDAVLQKVVSGLAGIWGDPVENLAALLLTRESDPRATITLLTDWERAWGLPDPCAPVPTSITERHQALVAKMTLLGGQSRAFFIEDAAAIGYTITIDEYSPFMCGISSVGDTRFLNAAIGDSATRYRWEIGSPDMRFYWTANVNSVRETYFHCAGGECGITPLLGFSLPIDLECMLMRWKPAHTDVIFNYSPVSSYESSYLIMGIP